MKIQSPVFMWRHLFYIMFLVFFTPSGYSQEAGSCAENLKTAQTLFEKGQVQQVPAILRECMKSGFNKEESLSAYRLLIQSYLFEDKLDLADSTMLAFLKKNPEYQLSPTDHSSFVHLFNNFNVKPVVQISIHLGTNVPFVTFVNNKSTAGFPGKNTYQSKALNLFFSFESKFKISKKVEFNFETGYSQLKFTNIEDFVSSVDDPVPHKKITYTEIQRRLEFPLSITYDIKSFGKFTPYVRIGAGPAITLGSTSTIRVDPYDINSRELHTGSDINWKDSRISMDLFTQFGGGIKFKTPGGFIIAEIRSNLGILNQTVRGGASSDDPPWTYYYEADDLHLNSLNITLGYTKIFYNPTKRKE